MLCQTVAPVQRPSPEGGDRSPTEAVVRLHSEIQVKTALSDLQAQDRAELESFIHDVFARAYGADIQHYLPQLLSLRDPEGELLAVCGFRRGTDKPLFLEQYLGKPVEQAIRERLGVTVSRDQLIEVGNLAIGNPRHARSLLAAVSLYLHTQTEWAVFTGTASLCNGLSKLNLELFPLGTATIDSIPAHERGGWGSYYAERPIVMAIRNRHIHAEPAV
jgi:hypothetical protein